MKIKHGYDCGMQCSQQDAASSIVEGRMVPRDLSKFEELGVAKSSDFIYVDAGGEPKKLAVGDLVTSGIEVVATLPLEAIDGQLVFLKVGYDLYKLYQYKEDDGWKEMKVGGDASITSFIPTQTLTSLTVQEAIESLDSTKASTANVYTKQDIKQVALTGKAANLYNDVYKTMDTTNVQSSLEYLFDSIGTGGTGAVVNVMKQTTPETGNSATYYVTQGGSQVGTKINIPEVEVKTTSAITVTQNVGGYKVGDVIPANTTLLNIIKNILAPEVPVIPTKVYYGVSTAIPTSLTGLTSAVVNESVLKSTGYDATLAPNNQYNVFAYPKTVGNLAHIYQNDMTMFDLLENWTKIELSHVESGVSVVYNVYYSTKDRDPEGSKYTFKW